MSDIEGKQAQIGLDHEGGRVGISGGREDEDQDKARARGAVEINRRREKSRVPDVIERAERGRESRAMRKLKRSSLQLLCFSR
jgi:hypothetical protein